MKGGGGWGEGWCCCLSEALTGQGFARHPRLSAQHLWSCRRSALRPCQPSGAEFNSSIHRHQPAERWKRRGGEVNECKQTLLLHTCQLVGTLRASIGIHFSAVTQFRSLIVQSRRNTTGFDSFPAGRYTLNFLLLSFLSLTIGGRGRRRRPHAGRTCLTARNIWTQLQTEPVQRVSLQALVVCEPPHLDGPDSLMFQRDVKDSPQAPPPPPIVLGSPLVEDHLQVRWLERITRRPSRR